MFGEVFQSDALRKLIAEDMGVASVEGTISIELVSETNLMLLTVTSIPRATLTKWLNRLWISTTAYRTTCFPMRGWIR